MLWYLWIGGEGSGICGPFDSICQIENNVARQDDEGIVRVEVFSIGGDDRPDLVETIEMV